MPLPDAERVGLISEYWETVCDDAKNLTGTARVDFDLGTLVVAVVVAVLALCIIVINTAILYISKFATGGHSPILIFVRSMCVGDCFIGVYGILKVIFMSVDTMQVNCFLVESILFSSITSSVFTLLCLTLDSFIGLVYPLKYRSCVDKQFVILMMIVLWNAAIILGFSPLMGWNDETPDIRASCHCDFFAYYSTSYFALTTGIFTLSIAVILSIQVKLHRVEKLGEWKYKLRPGTVHKIKRVLTIVRLDSLTTTVFYLPFFVFLFVFCEDCPLTSSHVSGNDVYVFLVPWLLLKSVINSIIHGSTTQFQQVVKDAKNGKSIRGWIGKERRRTTRTSIETLCRESTPYFVPTVISDHLKEFSKLDSCRLPSNSTLQTTASTDSIIKRDQLILGDNGRKYSLDSSGSKKRSRSIDYAMFAPVGPKLAPRVTLQIPHIKLPPKTCRHPHHLHDTNCPMYKSRDDLDNGVVSAEPDHRGDQSFEDDFPSCIEEIGRSHLNNIEEDESEIITRTNNSCTALPCDGITPL